MISDNFFAFNKFKRVTMTRYNGNLVDVFIDHLLVLSNVIVYKLNFGFLNDLYLCGTINS